MKSNSFIIKVHNVNVEEGDDGSGIEKEEVKDVWSRTPSQNLF